jgi:hypothetical protein
LNLVFTQHNILPSGCTKLFATLGATTVQSVD